MTLLAKNMDAAVLRIEVSSTVEARCNHIQTLRDVDNYIWLFRPGQRPLGSRPTALDPNDQTPKWEGGEGVAMVNR